MRVLSISLDDRKIPPTHCEIRMTQDILKRENIPAVANIFNGKSVTEPVGMNARHTLDIRLYSAYNTGTSMNHNETQKLR